MVATPCIAYYRVSTDRQGRSGLGLDAQHQAIAAFLKSGSWALVEEVTEVESGKRADRPKLAQALEACRRRKATLVIAKLDRLARNVAFISNLMEAGVEFVAADMPTANRLTVHILAAVAEHEREMIRGRTKAALAAAKARGTRLGWSIESRREEQRRAAARGVATNRRQADQHAAAVLPIIEVIRAGGATTLRAIAAELNRRHILTARGGAWYASTVRSLLLRVGALTPQ